MIIGGGIMNVMFESEYYPKSSIDDCKVSSTDFSNDGVQKLIEDAGYGKVNDKALEAVCAVGNKNISSIDLDRFKYTVSNREISLTNLCTAEYCFLMAELSLLTGNRVIIINSIRELSNRVLRIFVERYKDANVTVVFADGLMNHYYRVVAFMEEV